MKQIFILLLFFISQFVRSTELHSIYLEKNEKLEGTYSININKNETAHFLYVKNTDSKKYLIKPYYLSADKKVKILDSFILDEIPNIISNHFKKDVITICSLDQKNKNLHIIDFDLVSGKNKVKIKESYKMPDAIFKESDRTILVNFIDYGKKIATSIISNSQSSEQNIFNLSSKIFNEFQSFVYDKPDAINQNEFVENGSINPSKIYLFNNKLYFTFKKEKQITQVLSLDLQDNNSVTLNNFDFNFPKFDRYQNSYVIDDYLIATSVNNLDVNIKKYDLNSNKFVSELSFSKDLKSLIDKNTFDNFFIKSKKFNMSTTVVVNKTKNNNLKIRLGFVNKDNYYYNYNWWFHHNFMMQSIQMQQIQRMQFSGGRGFGPNNLHENDFINAVEKEFVPIEFVVNLDFKIESNQKEETNHKQFDKDFLLEEFKENKNIKKFSSAFIDNEMRYIYQDNKSKIIYINYKPVD